MIKISVKDFLFVFVALLVFTEGLILLHDSKFEKNEYDRICHSIYDEKVWIDTCYFPYNSEIKTFETARNIEAVLVIGSLGALLFGKRLNG